jgi:hypothetical protein
MAVTHSDESGLSFSTNKKKNLDEVSINLGFQLWLRFQISKFNEKHAVN